MTFKEYRELNNSIQDTIILIQKNMIDVLVTEMRSIINDNSGVVSIGWDQDSGGMSAEIVVQSDVKDIMINSVRLEDGTWEFDGSGHPLLEEPHYAAARQASIVLCEMWPDYLEAEYGKEVTVTITSNSVDISK